ncbi:MAG: hypothetical protein ACLPYB_05840 [Desulfobaccales bacterium]
MKARTGLIVTFTALSLITGCASSPYLGTGALVGGGAGAIAGAAIDHHNPWQGALIGGLAGTALGAAGGYALQQRQANQPQPGQPPGPQPGQPQPGGPQGYNYPPQPGPGEAGPPAYGYGPPAPGNGPDPGYGYGPPAPGPGPDQAYGDNRGNPGAPQGPQESAAPPPGSYYGQGPPPQNPGVAAAPPAYGYGAPAPGAAPASAYSNTWTAVDPQGAREMPAPPPMANGPYYPEE